MTPSIDTEPFRVRLYRKLAPYFSGLRLPQLEADNCRHVSIAQRLGTGNIDVVELRLTFGNDTYYRKCPAFVVNEEGDQELTAFADDWAEEIAEVEGIEE